MPKAKTKPGKVPPVTVLSDDLEIVVDGETYHPHAGESVSFRGRQSVGDAMLAFSLQSLTEATDASEIHRTLSDVVSKLATRINGWTWTDDDGEAYESPPSAETLMRLSFEELGWLIGGGKAKADDLKNG